MVYCDFYPSGTTQYDELRDAYAAEATRLLVNRLLHAPTEAMKGVAAHGPDWRDMEKTLKALFRLEDEGR